MACPPVHGDNPRALMSGLSYVQVDKHVSGLSYVQVDKHGITILCHRHQCRPYTLNAISC